MEHLGIIVLLPYLEDGTITKFLLHILNVVGRCIQHERDANALSFP